MCVNCQGLTLLHFEDDRCRLQCRACEWVGPWLTVDEGKALVDIACRVLRSAGELLAERAAQERVPA